ncbi:MAG TPA: site-specific integrase [Phycisphaerales bacterium]|nr:MAG: hypothetical protein A2Y13_01310 [Planctomycetes bacterium GWC2_45_44]HBG77515.1 site-specific integrase [Phycisphaerales bacterium]HBR19123.1 site-specific integrase [Phycisphaerales bacterium]
MAKTEITGTIYLNHGRYWYRIKLPGETSFRQIPLKPTGSKYATKDYQVAQSIAEDVYKQLCQKKDTPLPDCKTIADLTIRYLTHAEGYYKDSREPENISYALKPLKELYGGIPLDDFGVDKLDQLREKMVEGKKQCRKVINKRISMICRMFKWAVSKQLCSIYTYQTLLTLESLKFGRSTARESKKVLPVPVEHIEAVLPFLSQTVADMVRLQLLTGMRSTELCTLRPCDVDRSKDIWIYKPTKFKNPHIENYERTVYLGKKAQAILEPYLLRLPGSYCFTPEEAERQAGRIRHKKYQPCYNRRSFYTAVNRGIKACNKDIKKKYKGVEIDSDKIPLIPHFHPHQFRHTQGTNVRAKMGLEVASASLGHKSLKISEVYAERDTSKAVEAAKIMG